jgi:hypothetical protein
VITGLLANSSLALDSFLIKSYIFSCWFLEETIVPINFYSDMYGPVTWPDNWQTLENENDFRVVESSIVPLGYFDEPYDQESFNELITNAISLDETSSNRKPKNLL